MFFPLSLEKKEIFITNIDNGLSPIFKEKDIFNKRVDIPIENHPGSFGFVRKNHIHEGIDLYTNFLEPVYSISSGKIIDISQFTGEKVNSPWWNDTWAVLVEHDDFVINYGEIKPSKKLYINQIIKTKTLIGYVVPVLKKDKGRPMNMLHFECYTKDTKKSLSCWQLNTEKPKNLINPTDLLLNIISHNK